jgi:hypothetical protein
LNAVVTARLFAVFLPGALHLSLEADPRPNVPFVVHLSAHAVGEVELALTALPATPETVLGPPETSPPRLHAPPLLSKAESLRAGVLRSYRELHAALSPGGRELLRDLFGLSQPLGQALHEKGEQSWVSPGLIAAWRVDAAEQGWNEFDLDVGPLSAGLYRLSARRGDEWTEVRILVTELSLLAVRDAAGLGILGTRAGSGEVVADVEIFARRQGRVQSLGKTSAQGLLALRGGLGATDWAEPTSAQLCGQRGEWLARIGLPPPPIHVPAETGTAALFLDRPRYVAGDTVHLWALPRELRSVGGFDRSLSIPDSNRVGLSLLDREGHTLWQRASDMDPLGVVSAEVDLPPGLLSGEYTFVLSWGEERRGVGFLVDAGVPPEVSARVVASSRQGFSVSVVDRLRRPLPQALVRWTALRLPPSQDEAAPLGPFELLASGSGITAQSGTLEVRLVHSLPPQARIAVQAEVEDPAGRTASAQGELPAPPPSSTTLRLRPERLLLRPGRQASLAVETRGPDRSPRRVKLAVLLQPLVEGANGEPQKREPIRQGLETDAHGRAALVLPPFSPGYVEVDVSVEGEPISAQALLFVTESGGDIPTTPDRLLLVPEPVEHRHGREGGRTPGTGEEQRVLVMTPFDSGTVLLALEPSLSATSVLVSIHGYSGVAHLHLPVTSAGLFMSAAATQGGRLFQERLQLAPPSRPLGMLVRGSFEHPPRSGQRAVLSLQTDDGLGRPLPSKVLGRLSPDGEESVPLFDQFRPAFAPWAVFSASRAWRSSEARLPPVREKDLVPYGPSRLGEPEGPRAEIVSFVAETSESGRGQEAMVLPSWLASTGLDGLRSATAATLTLRAVAGPDQLGENRQVMPLQPSPHLLLSSPSWVRPGDAPLLDLELRGSDGMLSPNVCQAELFGNGAAIPARCDFVSARSTATAQISGAAKEFYVVATLESDSALRLSAQRQVPVWGGEQPPRTTRDLAQRIARGLALPGALGEEANLACAAIRAVGAVLAADQKLSTQSVMHLAQVERPEGGFGPDEGELRRDVAALDGLGDLRAWVDPALLERTRARVKVLSDRLEDDARRALWLPDDHRGGTAARAEIDLGDVSPRDLSHRLKARSLSPPEVQPLLRRLAVRLSTADVLDAAEIAASFDRLPPLTPVDAEVGGLAIVDARRSYEVLRRTGWTEALLASGDEPPEATRVPLAKAPLSLGAEVVVTLEAELAQGGLHCVRDALPAGLAPVGLSASVVRDGSLLFCAEPRDGRLTFSYGARAMHAGRFVAPRPVLGVLGPSAASVETADVVEILP